jgi:hypothetical protein
MHGFHPRSSLSFDFPVTLLQSADYPFVSRSDANVSVTTKPFGEAIPKGPFANLIRPALHGTRFDEGTYELAVLMLVHDPPQVPSHQPDVSVFVS